MWRGSIRAEDPTERALLQGLGVRVGYWSARDQDFRDCAMTSEALVALQPHWGRFVWNLDEVKSGEPARSPRERPRGWRPRPHR
jgi:hypothetical protein